MATRTQQIQTVDIYHGLPVFPENVEGLTAVITGANGISGYYMLRALSQSPKRWRKIYCLSRRPPYMPGGLPENAEHIALDFLKKPEEIAEVLKGKGIKADYVFYFAYLQPAPKGGGVWSDVAELVRVNSLLLDNFLGALKLAGIKPKRFMLQTGAKNYGVHMGTVKAPQEESDPRVELEPNFYYTQEDSLFEYCREQGVGWNILMPGVILGAVLDAAMNFAFPLAVYAAVCAELKQPLEWPSDIEAWQSHSTMSSALMNGEPYY
jgi:nucleoside-diphosphate-sugar epimerase